MSFDELLEEISRLSRSDKVRLRQWLDQQLVAAELEIRGHELSLEAEVREIRAEGAARDYLPSLD